MPISPKVISPPLDYCTTIAETTQSRWQLRININKLNEVKGLSGFDRLLSYVTNISFEGEEWGEGVKSLLHTKSAFKTPVIKGWDSHKLFLPEAKAIVIDFSKLI